MSELPDLTLEFPVPSVIADDKGLQQAVDTLAQVAGPVAVDAERASSYRYSQGAYLVQVYRAGGPAVLIDPLGISDFKALAALLGGAEWIMQAAHNDLECLESLGLVPPSIFDTEIAAQLLGLERVGLASLVEQMLGQHMRKGHGQADWSKRPLRPSWLEYAVLDVVVLPDLREQLRDRLAEAGKSQWAEQEFTHQIRTRTTADPADRWRRTSGAGRLRTDAQRGALRALWQFRDEQARSRDVAWHRVAKDAQLVAMASKLPADRDQLAGMESLPRNILARPQPWLDAIARGTREPQPKPSLGDGPPGRSPKVWEHRDPEAAARLVDLRAAVKARAEELQVWTQTLLGADVIAALAWQPPAEPRSRMAELGARPWQIEHTHDLVEHIVGPS